MKSNDASHEDSKKLYEEHRGDIQTSLLAIAELLAGCEKHGVDPKVVVGSIFEIAQVSGITLEEAMRAADYMEEAKLKAFDALHCALAGDQIMSADKGFDKTGIKRVWSNKGSL